MPITLKDLENPDRIPQRRIQEENVLYGDAYCANETKHKSIEKLRRNLMALPPQPPPLTLSRTCTVQIDSVLSITQIFPPGKTRSDLVKVILEFFES